MLLAFFLSAALGQQAASDAAVQAPATTALVITYADGKTATQLVSTKPGSWWVPVSYIPRIADWAPAPGTLPVRALQIRRVLDNGVVLVEVSVLRGMSHEVEETVEAVRIDRITLRNLGNRAAANFRVQAYRGDQPALSLIPRGTDARPVLVPGGTHTFDVVLTTATAVPLDRIEIASVFWDDGAFTGGRTRRRTPSSPTRAAGFSCRAC